MPHVTEDSINSAIIINMSFHQAVHSDYMNPQPLKILYMCSVVNWCIFSLYLASFVWLMSILVNFFAFEGEFKRKTTHFLKSWSSSLFNQSGACETSRQKYEHDIEGMTGPYNGANCKTEYISSHIPGSLFLKTAELKYSTINENNNDNQSVVTTIYPTPSTLYNLYAQNSGIKQQLLGKQPVNISMVHPTIVDRINQISSNEDRCPVCTEEFQCDDFVQALPCSHYYHTKCISKWITQHEESKCPLCQFDIEDKISVATSSPEQGYGMYTPVVHCSENLESGGLSSENELANVVNEFGSA
ncbi:BA75_04925T0 [Komagataella pastoris]|uniref:BA75_04925T0 n=1 Tax=Komagataella pastoris TaxID=4922 RepID=A0A1B2JHL6_PICPA|nr:BA75_04925T0 [Komagataella pastoris]